MAKKPHRPLNITGYIQGTIATAPSRKSLRRTLRSRVCGGCCAAYA